MCLEPKAGYYINNGIPVSTCPTNKYPLKTDCQPCDSTCKTCIGGSDKNCTSCTTPTFLSDFRCISTCPNSYYGNE